MYDRIPFLLISAILALPATARAGAEFAYGAGNCETAGVKVILLQDDPRNLHMHDPSVRLPTLAIVRFKDIEPGSMPEGFFDTTAIVGTMNDTDFRGAARTTQLTITQVESETSRIFLKSRDGDGPWRTMDQPATCRIKQEGGGSGGAHN